MITWCLFYNKRDTPACVKERKKKQSALMRFTAKSKSIGLNWKAGRFHTKPLSYFFCVSVYTAWAVKEFKNNLVQSAAFISAWVKN